MSSRTPNDVLRHRTSRTAMGVTKHTYNTRSSARLKDIFVNSKEREELMTACSKGDLPKVVELLESKKTGLNPDLIRDSKLRTPLLVACAAGQAAIVKQLIKWGADVNNAMGDIVGNKPLDLAVISNDVDTVLVLLEAGAKVGHFNDTTNQIQPDDGLPLQTRLRAAKRTPLDLANSRLDLLLRQAEITGATTKSDTMEQVLKIVELLKHFLPTTEMVDELNELTEKISSIHIAADEKDKEKEDDIFVMKSLKDVISKINL